MALDGDATPEAAREGHRTRLGQVLAEMDLSCDAAIQRFERAGRDLNESISVSPRQFSRWVNATGANGPHRTARRVLHHAFGVPANELLGPPNEGSDPARNHHLVTAETREQSSLLDGAESAENVDRRDLLRLITVTGTLMAASGMDSRLDGSHQERRSAPLDSRSLDDFSSLNAHLWQVFTLSVVKSSSMSAGRSQLNFLMSALQRSSGAETHRRLCEQISELLQLIGEIFFDGDKYTEAAYCYSLAASAAREAGALDLWGCALTRHAFISMYERRFADAAPLLDLASRLARQGNDSLSTRYWVSAVQAQAFAGMGDFDSCQRALADAERVNELRGEIHNGGWLRFDGSRIAEERGRCYVEMNRPDLAESILDDALSRNLPARRRGMVLADLAVIGLQRHDLGQAVAHGQAALDAVKASGSAVVGRRLQGLQERLSPFLRNRQVLELYDSIDALHHI